MTFNHYAKLKRIIEDQPEGWFIRRIDEPTIAINFKGEQTKFDCYYRLCGADGTYIKYGKFQQLERLAQMLKIPAEELPVVS